MENGPFIDYLAFKHGDFPSFFVSLSENRASARQLVNHHVPYQNQ